MRIKRESEDFTANESAIQLKKKRIKRESEDFTANESAIHLKMRNKRKNKDFRAKNNVRDLGRYKSMKGNLSCLILEFRIEISQGPTNVCSCCGCLHFKRSVVLLKREKLTNKFTQEFVNKVRFLHYVCYVFCYFIYL